MWHNLQDIYLQQEGGTRQNWTEGQQEKDVEIYGSNVPLKLFHKGEVTLAYPEMHSSNLVMLTAECCLKAARYHFITQVAAVPNARWGQRAVIPMGGNSNEKQGSKGAMDCEFSQ